MSVSLFPVLQEPKLIHYSFLHCNYDVHKKLPAICKSTLHPSPFPKKAINLLLKINTVRNHMQQISRPHLLFVWISSVWFILGNNFRDFKGQIFYCIL